MKITNPFGGKKLFGSDLFSFKKPDPEPEDMYDFAKDGVVRDGRNDNNYGTDPIAYVLTKEDLEKIKEEARNEKGKKKATPKKKEPKFEIHLTPKGIYEMKALNAHEFFIKTDPDYIEEQIKDLNDKLKLVGGGKKKKDKVEQTMYQVAGGVYYAQREIESIIERLKNRSKLSNIAIQAVVDKYPHTTTELIVKVLGIDKDLQCRKATDFVPDFPKVAIDAMKEYQEMCLRVSKKKTHFYVIANNKDFEIKNRRRDPILLAQSPFGFFWNILGAWDSEMIYLGDL